MKNYYEILGLPNFATIPEAKKAFKSLAMQYHPDKNPDNPAAEEQFKLINEAHRILTNEQAKANYDSLLASGYNHENIADLARQTDEYRQKQQQKYTAYQDFVRRNAPKDYHVTNTQGVILAFLVVFYALSFANNLVNGYARLQYWFALQSYEQKQYKQTVAHLEKSIHADETFEKSAALLGKLKLEKFANYDVAVENLNLAIRHAEKYNPLYHYQRGLAYCHLAKPKEAATDFERLLRQFPDSLALKQQIATHYYYVLRSDTLATALYKEILKKDSTQQDALLNLGTIYYNHNNFQLAQNYFTTIIRQNKPTAEVWAKRSLCLLALQNAPAACQDWLQAKKLQPELTNPTLDFFCVDTLR